MINVCVPVLKRYDLLRDMLRSLQASTVTPDFVYVIDNGRDPERLRLALGEVAFPTIIHRPEQRSLGVAESWNWFIQNVPEQRVIVNDDVEFAPWSLAKLLASKADIVWAAGVGFSCYVLRDSCVQKIGLFDEDISPGYGYYEDEDYLQRLDGHGTRAPSAIAENVDCGVKHYHSATLKAASHTELLEHHRRFKVAQMNYIKKWHLEETFK
jgi:GT2 family glycosyltransferase